MLLSKVKIMTVKIASEYACPMHCEGDKVYIKPGD